ncbi:MAG: phytoene desaturase family protein [Anaerolineae bacterium]
MDRAFDEAPETVAGVSFPLERPTRIGAAVRERLAVRLLNYDLTLAPPGKTTLVVTLAESYTYWKELAQDRAAYKAEREKVGRTVVALLDRRFPGLVQQVEVVDVATPVTFERYTGNWKGSFEGWLLTPQNAFTMIRPMSQTLPGLARFYMCGQWVEPGGGLPTSVMSGRRLVQRLCEEDGKRFETEKA